MKIPAKSKIKTPVIERKAWRVSEFNAAYRLSNATTYKLLKSGKLHSVLVGGRRIIPVEAVTEWLNSSQS